MWGMRWTGTANYVYYALTGLAFAAVWLWRRAPAQLQRAERKAGRAPSPPASHPVRRGHKAPARIPGDDGVPGDDRLRQPRPLTDDEREKFEALLLGLKNSNQQQGEST